MKPLIQLCFCVLASLTILCLPLSAAQNQLQTIDVAADGKVTLYFSELPVIAKSSLSTQKTQISLQIPNCSISDNARNVAGAGMVERIFVQRSGQDAMVYLELRKRSGYSLLVLPYSSGVRVNVVNWLEMSESEEHYHSGLLALESGAHAAAQYEFAKAGNHPDAKTMLGLMHLRKGEQEQAKEFLVEAAKLKSDIPDAYAGLSEIESAAENPDAAAQLAQTFYQMSNRSSIPALMPLTAPQTAEFDEPPTLAESIVVPGRDSSPATDNSLDDDGNAETEKQDSAADSSAQAQGTPALALSASDTAGRGPSEFALKYGNPREMRSQQLKSLMPDWIKWAAAGIALLAVVGGTGLAVFYWRWRKKKLAKKSDQPAAGGDFETMVREALASEDAESAKQADQPLSQNSNSHQKQADVNQDGEHHSAYAPKPGAADLAGTFSQAEHSQAIGEAEAEPVDEEWLAALDDNSPVSTFSAAQAGDTAAAAKPSAEAQRATIKTMQSSGAALDMAQKLGRSRMQARISQLADVEASEIPQGRQDRAALARSLGVTAGELRIKQTLGRLESQNETEEYDKLSSIFSQQTGSNLKNS